MKPLHSLHRWYLPIVVLLVLCGMTIGSAPVFALSGSATSSAMPSDNTPSIGEQIEVSIIIDVTHVDPPDHRLGSFTATLDWNPAVLAYNSNSGILAGFTGAINPADVASGHIVFNGANPTGATGVVTVFRITFDVVGAGISDLDLEHSALAASYTFENLLPILTVTDGQVQVQGSPTEYTLTMAVDPAGGGTTNPAVGTHAYSEGTVVNVTATPHDGYAFDHWSGACTGNGACQVTMNTNRAVTAHFTQDEYSLTVTVVGNGAVSKDPDESTYTYGQEVELTATAGVDWTFDYWSGGLTGSANPASIIMDGDKTITAHFTQDEYSLTVTVVGNGAVSKDPDENAYTYGQEIELTAMADGGWAFDHWSGALADSANPTGITMDGDKAVTATFTKLPPELSLTKDDGRADAKPGDMIIYMLTYNNTGGDATGVTITETIPAHTAFNSAASTSGWVCQPDGSAGSLCIFNLTDVTNSGGGTVEFAVTVDDPLPADVTEINNTARIGDDGIGGADANLDNNVAGTHTMVKPSPGPDDYVLYFPLILRSQHSSTSYLAMRSEKPIIASAANSWETRARAVGRAPRCDDCFTSPAPVSDVNALRLWQYIEREREQTSSQRGHLPF